MEEELDCKEYEKTLSCNHPLNLVQDHLCKNHLKTIMTVQPTIMTV